MKSPARNNSDIKLQENYNGAFLHIDQSLLCSTLSKFIVMLSQNFQDTKTNLSHIWVENLKIYGVISMVWDCADRGETWSLCFVQFCLVFFQRHRNSLVERVARKKQTNKQTMWNWRVRITAPEIILCPIEYDDFRQKFRPKLCQSKKMFNFFESLLALPYRWCNFYYFVCTLIDHTELFTSWTHESSFCGILWA